MTVKQIEQQIADLIEGQRTEIEMVQVHRCGGDWWVQAGGGCTFHATAYRAAQQARKLIRHLVEG